MKKKKAQISVEKGCGAKGDGEIAGDSDETRPRNMCEFRGEPWELRRHWI